MRMSPGADRGGKKKNRVQSAIWVLKMAWEVSPGLLTGKCACHLLSGAVPAGIAWISRNLIDTLTGISARGSGAAEEIAFWVIASFGIVLFGEVVSTAGNLFGHLLKDRLYLEIETRKLCHAAKLDLASFEDPDFQDIIERTRQSTSVFYADFLDNLLKLVTDLLKAIGLGIVIWTIAPIIVLAVVLVVLPYVLFRWRHAISLFDKEYARATKRRWSHYFTWVLTHRNAVPEAKVLGLAPLLIRRYRRMIRNFIREDRRLFTKELAGNLLFTALFALVFYLLFMLAARQVLENRLTLGDVVVLAGIAGHLRILLGSFAAQVGTTIGDMLFVENLIAFFGISPPAPKHNPRSAKHDGENKISISHLCFTYPGSQQKVLSDISFTMHPGETIALVGCNGAGKTTLIKLIAGLYVPTAGSILLDGIPLETIHPEERYRQFTVLFSRPNRYEATAAENIWYGNWKKGDGTQQAAEAARAINLDTLIRDFPNGYDTLLGRRFGRYDLSSGQWKKIAIARALSRQDAPVLLMDEPLVNLDPQAQVDFYTTLGKRNPNRTTLIISHQLPVIQLADRIVLLEKGRIVETGSHEKLITTDTRYAKLFCSSSSFIDRT